MKSLTAYRLGLCQRALARDLPPGLTSFYLATARRLSSYLIAGWHDSAISGDQE